MAQRVEVKEVVVISGAPELDMEEVHRLREALPPWVLLIRLPEGASLATLDEDQMAEHGWTKVKAKADA